MPYRLIFSDGFTGRRRGGLPTPRTGRALSELVDVDVEAAAEVGSLVLGYDVLAAKTEKEGLNLRIGCLCFCLVGHLAYAANGVTGCLGPITVAYSSLLRLADSFE